MTSPGQAICALTLLTGVAEQTPLSVGTDRCTFLRGRGRRDRAGSERPRVLQEAVLTPIAQRKLRGTVFSPHSRAGLRDALLISC